MQRKRNYNPRQRKILYQLANGKCQQCGRDLEDSFHADHHFPFSKGGRTTLKNGRALCPSCNLLKKDRMERKQFQPRKWQERCLGEFLSANKQKFSIGAVPGAGKSKAAMWIMWTLLEKGEIDMIFAVSPQGNKKQEWYEDAIQYFGIPLQPNYSSTAILKTSKFKGAILTYQGVNENLMPDIRRLCQTKRIGVIADEPHHLSDAETSSWGRYFKESFAHAKYMIFLSGTYWREDRTRIPFLDYDADTKRYILDYEYDYTDSLMDGNSRKIEFEFYNPNIVFNDDYNDVHYEGPMSDVGDEHIDKCYRKLVTERNNDLKSVIQDALVKLDEVRTTGEHPMPDAGMIIFAPNIETAEALRHWLHTDKDFGHVSCTVVHNDEQGASDKLEQFKRSAEKVLISVNMVSEGIDIPRLRVGVFLSIFKTRLFFMQSIVGRLIRVRQDEYNKFQTGEMPMVNFSYAYMLKHPILLDFAKQVEGEIQLAEIVEREKPEKREFVSKEPSLLDFSTVEVIDLGQKEYVNSGHHLVGENTQELDTIFQNCPEIIDPNTRSYLRLNIANFIKSKAPVLDPAPPIADPVTTEENLFNSLKKLRNKIGGLLIQKGGAEKDKVFRDLSIHFREKFGPLDKSKNDVSFDTLKRANAYAKAVYHELNELGAGNAESFNNSIKRWRHGK